MFSVLYLFRAFLVEWRSSTVESMVIGAHVAEPTRGGTSGAVFSKNKKRKTFLMSHGWIIKKAGRSSDDRLLLQPLARLA